MDARYERVREAGVIVSQAVLIAVAVDTDGRRQILAVELANRESRSSWRDFLTGLKTRGLAGVEFVVSDDHPGLKQAIREVLPEAAWQRCYVGLLKKLVSGRFARFRPCGRGGAVEGAADRRVVRSGGPSCRRTRSKMASRAAASRFRLTAAAVR